MITYLLQLTICWSAFYLAYHFMLKDETHFEHSRWYLLLALTLGLVIPLVDWANYFIHEPESLGNLYITPFNAQMAEWDVTVTATETQAINWYLIFQVIYGLGVLLMGGKLIHSWIKIEQIRRNSIRIDHDNYTLVLTDQHHLPFSFLGSVYCSEIFFRECPDVDQILAHEEHHIRSQHSIDIIFMELLKIIFWFHPLIYLYKKEIQQIHEYQADHAAYQLSSRRQYGQLLLSHIESAMPMALANHFFNSQLKNRFKMMTKKTSTRQSVWKYFVMLPMVAGTILLFSYSSQGKSLVNKVMVMQDTLLPPPPPVAAPPASPPVKVAPPLPPPPPPISPSIDEVKVVGYSGSSAAPGALPPPPPPAVKEVRISAESGQQDEIFRVVEEMPRFPGCEGQEGSSQEIKKCADLKMLEFIYTNVRYPAAARQNGIEGAVVAQFIVEADGSISNPAIMREPDASLGEEALRLIELMGKEKTWIPGRQRGQDVRVMFILPIKFELAKTEENQAEIHINSEKTDPIFVLDGQVMGRVSKSNLNETVNPNDIESITVLKGDSALEKYGEIGEAGVIEIITKWPEQRKSNLNLESVNIYPVPVSNQLHIQTTVPNSGEYRLEIRNLKGQVVKNQVNQIVDDRIDATFQLDGLNAGAYYLVISHQGRIFSQAFIKQ